MKGLSQNFFESIISSIFPSTNLDKVYYYKINGYDTIMTRPLLGENITSHAIYTKITDNFYDFRRIYFNKDRNEFFYIEKSIAQSIYKDIYEIGNNHKLNIQILNDGEIRFPFNLTFDQDFLFASGQFIKITDFLVVLDSYIKDNNFKNGQQVNCKLEE